MMTVFLQTSINRVSVDIVTFPVTVKDQTGQHVLNLTAESFAINAGKKEQKPGLLRAGDFPLSVGLVVDDSGSMRNKRQRLHSAAVSLVTQSNPENGTFLVSFGSSANLEQGFTSSVGNI